MQHSDTIQKAIDYIESNLFGSACLMGAARAAGYSVPHIHRLFLAHTGHTIGDYVLRRRLSQAAEVLVSSRSSIAEIAFAHGFESHDVFTRAFSRVYGMTPSQCRKQGGAPPFGPLVPCVAGFAAGQEHIRFSVVDLPGFQVAGWRCNALEWDADGAIGRLWSGFLPVAEGLEGRSIPAVMYGLCETGPIEPGRFPYLAAVGVWPGSRLPAGLVVRDIRPQRYLQACVPETMAVPEAYAHTLGFAAERGLAVDDYDFIEVYEETFRDPADHSFILLIPIKCK